MAVGLGIVRLYDAEGNTVERYSLRGVVVEDDALVLGKRARTVVHLAASAVNFLNQQRIFKRLAHCYHSHLSALLSSGAYDKVLKGAVVDMAEILILRHLRHACLVDTRGKHEMGHALCVGYSRERGSHIVA